MHHPTRMRGTVPPLTPYVFMAWYLAKPKDNFTLPYLTTPQAYYLPHPSGTDSSLNLVLILPYVIGSL